MEGDELNPKTDAEEKGKDKQSNEEENVEESVEDAMPVDDAEN